MPDRPVRAVISGSRLSSSMEVQMIDQHGQHSEYASQSGPCKRMHPIVAGCPLCERDDEIERLRDEHEKLIAAVCAAREIRGWGVELDDARIGYITVQVGRVAVEEFDAALVAVADIVGAGE